MKHSLIITVALVFALGIVMIFSTTSAEVLDQSLSTSTSHALLKQLLYGTFGAMIAFYLWKKGYHQFIQLSPLLLGILIVMLILTLIPGIGREVNGSRRWLGIGGVSFQPSEFVKIILPAYFIYRQSYHFFKLLTICTIPIFLILIEPNNGTAGVIAITLIVLFYLTKVSAKYWALPITLFLIAGSLFASQLPYVSGRLKVYLNPELDVMGRGHQPRQAKIAAGSGRLFGKGPGNSWQKLSYLPEAQNDYIAAIYAEEFGFLGVLFLIFLYFLFTYLGFSIAYQATDLQGFYLASAIIFIITFQAFLNLGVVSGLLPSTGLNLPFFSQGGTSLIANFMAVGLLLSIPTHNLTTTSDIVLRCSGKK